MRRTLHFTNWQTWAVFCCACLFALGVTLPTSAQDEPAAEEAMEDEPAAEDEMPAEEPAEEEEATEEKPRPRRGRGAAEEEAAPVRPAGMDDPAAQAVLESNPQTPYELLRAVRILADLKYPQLAQPFVEALTKAKLDTAAKAALVNRFHSAELIKLASNPELSKTLGPFIDDLFKSATEYRREPKRMSEWAAQLTSPNENDRARATHALLQAREAAVAPLVAILADPKRAKEHATARRLLLALGNTAVEPLRGVLEAPDPALVAQVMEILGTLEGQTAAAQLLGPLVSPASTPQVRAAAAAALRRIIGHTPGGVEAVQLLEQAAARALEQTKNEAGDANGPVDLWHWDPKLNQSVPVAYDYTGAALANAVRLSRDLYLLDRNDPARRRLYLTALLQLAKFRAGFDNPLPTSPGTAYSFTGAHGPVVVEDVLVHAMRDGYLPAAIAAAQILGDIGSLDLLAKGGVTPSPLAAAAGHADRRLRFAALAAIMKLNPTEPFAGSAAVTDGLAYFAKSYGTPRVLIAHPLSAEAQSLAGLAAALGYEADTATTGRAAFDLATRSPDYEFALIHSAIDRPAADELLAQLRRDRRTAMLPVGLIAPVDDLERVTDFARRSVRAEAFLQPRKEEEMRIFVGDLLARAGRSHVPAAVRKAQAQEAMNWLVALSEKPQRVFDLGRLEPTVIALLYEPDVAAKATELLSAISTDKGQRALIEVIDSAAQPLGLRQAAVAALARSFRAHGILLTSKELLHQYDIYNANAGSDRETHEVLAAVLDLIENKGDTPEEN